MGGLDFKKRKNQLIILLLFGILLIVIAIPTGTDKKKETDLEVTAQNSKNDAYEEDLENKLEQVLNEIEGVGKVKVMITFQASSEKVVEKDETETVYEHLAGGEEIPYVIKEISAKPEGVAVIAQGGENAVVKQNIIETVQALFGVEAHKIKVTKMNSSK